MATRSYTPISLDLPTVYQRDAVSFAQVDSYLGLIDDLNRGFLQSIDETMQFLSPAILDVWPPGLPLDAGHERLTDAYVAALDEMAHWFGFVFPSSWAHKNGALDLPKRRDFLRRAARFWRRRATPRGFVDWLSFAFDIDAEHRPILIEHFKIADSSGEVCGRDAGLRCTLLLRVRAPLRTEDPLESESDREVRESAEQFAYFDRRQELLDFVEAYAPAHVHVRTCWVFEDYSLPVAPEQPGSESSIQDYAEAMQQAVSGLVSDVPHSLAISLSGCDPTDPTTFDLDDELGPKDELGIALLPTRTYLED